MWSHNISDAEKYSWFSRGSEGNCWKKGWKETSCVVTANTSSLRSWVKPWIYHQHFRKARDVHVCLDCPKVVSLNPESSCCSVLISRYQIQALNMSLMPCVEFHLLLLQDLSPGDGFSLLAVVNAPRNAVTPCWAFARLTHEVINVSFAASFWSGLKFPPVHLLPCNSSLALIRHHSSNTLWLLFIIMPSTQCAWILTEDLFWYKFFQNES